ncbi:MAG: hypothetical protein HS114_19400 [Anaerolineales bacterium]|nr:hypothetical protein [Anaerolineales bacterium]
MPVVETEEGVRATIKGEAIKPDRVQRYLENKFSGQTGPVSPPRSKRANSPD